MTLQMTDAVAGYGHTQVLRRVNLSVARNEVVALLGRNGMGKTTLLRTIAGQIPLTAGSFTLDDRSYSGSERLARAGLAFVPDDRGVFSTLTVDENLRLAHRRGYEPPVEVADIFPVIRERAQVKAGDLSGGQKQQLAIARAMLHGSRLIVIDEMSQGLQPSLVRAVLDAARTLASAGVATFFVDQSPELPLAHCDRILGMEKGAIVLDEPAERLREDPDRLGSLLVVG